MGRSTCSRNTDVDRDRSIDRDRVRDFGDFRFSNAFCYCKKMAAVRIVIGQGKPSRGKLYFTCETKECGFFKWCEPDRDVEITSQIGPNRASSSSSSVGGADFEELALNLTGITKKIQKLITVLSFVGLCLVVVATLVATTLM